MASTPKNAPNALLQAVFAQRVPVKPHFGGFWPKNFGSKMVQNGSKMIYSQNDTGPFGVSLEVFPARSEDSLSCFDLRRVEYFTYPQCAFQKMHALQNEVNGVK